MFVHNLEWVIEVGEEEDSVQTIEGKMQKVRTRKRRVRNKCNQRRESRTFARGAAGSLKEYRAFIKEIFA